MARIPNIVYRIYTNYTYTPKICAYTIQHSILTVKLDFFLFYSLAFLLLPSFAAFPASLTYRCIAINVFVIVVHWIGLRFISKTAEKIWANKLKCLQFLLFLLFVFWTETSTSNYRRTRNAYFVRVPWNILCIRCAHDRTFRFHSIHALRLSVYCNRSLDLQSNQLNAIDQIESTDKYYKYCMRMENGKRAKEQKCRDWIAFKN